MATDKYARLEKRYNALYDPRPTSDDTHLSLITFTLKATVITQPRFVEDAALKCAANLAELEPPAPLMTTPNRYANKKRCSCKEHEGDRWVHRSQFSYHPATVDHLQSWCKKCRAAKARFAYIPRWKRGV